MSGSRNRHHRRIHKRSLPTNEGNWMSDNQTFVPTQPTLPPPSNHMRVSPFAEAAEQLKKEFCGFEDITPCTDLINILQAKLQEFWQTQSGWSKQRTSKAMTTASRVVESPYASHRQKNAAKNVLFGAPGASIVLKNGATSKGEYFFLTYKDLILP